MTTWDLATRLLKGLNLFPKILAAPRMREHKCGTNVTISGWHVQGLCVASGSPSTHVTCDVMHAIQCPSGCIVSTKISLTMTAFNILQ